MGIRWLFSDLDLITQHGRLQKLADNLAETLFLIMGNAFGRCPR